MASVHIQSERIEVDDALAAIVYFEKGWTDGLPVVPPTEASIPEFLRHIDMEPDEIVGTVPARRRIVTAEKLAINAVMAGCKPEYMPVILAAFQAMCDEAYNIHGTSVTTGGPAPLVIVNGPIAKKLQINGNGPIWPRSARQCDDSPSDSSHSDQRLWHSARGHGQVDYRPPRQVQLLHL